MNKSVARLLAVMSAGTPLTLIAVFFWVPTDEIQGVAQRIFYIHVPAAWIAYLAYAVVLVSSIAYLKSNSPSWDHLAHASAETGVVFTGITLVTGMLWGRPVWGTFWVWDPRLTLTFVLFLIYCGYLAFRWMAADEGRAGRIAAVIGIAGFAAVPLIHFSVDLWRGQHPGRTVFRPEGSPALPGEMLITMLAMLAMFTLLYLLLMTMRIRLARLEAEVPA